MSSIRGKVEQIEQWTDNNNNNRNKKRNKKTIFLKKERKNKTESNSIV